MRHMNKLRSVMVGTGGIAKAHVEAMQSQT
jgi:hypothetical protein